MYAVYTFLLLQCMKGDWEKKIEELWEEKFSPPFLSRSFILILIVFRENEQRDVVKMIKKIECEKVLFIRIEPSMCTSDDINCEWTRTKKCIFWVREMDRERQRNRVRESTYIHGAGMYEKSGKINEFYEIFSSSFFSVAFYNTESTFQTHNGNISYPLSSINYY